MPSHKAEDAIATEIATAHIYWITLVVELVAVAVGVRRADTSQP